MTALFAAAVVSATVLFAVAGAAVVRRRVPVEVLEKQHEVGGFLYGALAVIYGILLAFVVFVVWTRYDAAAEAVAREADQLVDLVRLSQGLPEALRAGIRDAVEQYTKSAIEREWPAMRAGRASPDVERDIEVLWRLYARDAGSPVVGDSPILAASLDRMARLADARRARLGRAASRIPAMLWVLLLSGGAIMILFTYFFGIRSLRAQMLMTAALASQIALVLFLIAAIDRPFDGLMKIGPGPFDRVREVLAQRG